MAEKKITCCEPGGPCELKDCQHRIKRHSYKTVAARPLVTSFAGALLATADALGPRTKEVVDKTWEVCGCEQMRAQRAHEQWLLQQKLQRQAEVERREKERQEARQRRLQEVRASKDRATLADTASNDPDGDFRAAALLRLVELNK